MPPTEPATPVTRHLGDLAVDDYGHSDDRPALVLLHGLTFDRTIWRPLVEMLYRVDPGRRVVAVDLPGHGQSPEHADYALDAIPDLMHRSLEAAGITAPVMVGHSAGALGATIYAASHPVSGVINLDQSLRFEEFAGFVRSLQERLEGPMFDEVWQMFYDSFHTELLPAAARELVRSTCRPRQPVVLGYWRPMLDGRGDEVSALVERALAALGSTGVPYLHIMSEDPGPDYRRWFAERVPAVTFDVWPAGGHFPHLARPEEFIRALAGTASWAR